MEERIAECKMQIAKCKFSICTLQFAFCNFPLRASFALAVLLLTLPATSRAVRPADDEEPTVRGKKASAWLEMLQKDPQVERRQAAVIALGILGPKVPGVVLGISDALKDSDPAVRRSAALTLGR